MTLPAPGGPRSVAPIEVDGEPAALLVYDASLDDDPELVDAVRSAAAIAVEHEQLHTQSQQRLSGAAGLAAAHRRSGRRRAPAARA